MTTTKESLRRAVAHAVGPALEAGPEAVGTRRSVIIERIQPELDGGRHPVKRVVGDQLAVTADIYADGHDLLDAALLLRADDEEAWQQTPMRPVDNDRWCGARRAAPQPLAPLRDRGLARRVGQLAARAASQGRGLGAGAGRARGGPHPGRGGDDAGGGGRGGRRRPHAARRDRTVPTGAIGVHSHRRPRHRRGRRRHAPPPRSALARPVRRSCRSSSIASARASGPGTSCSHARRVAIRRQPKATTFVEAEWRLVDIAAMGFDVVYLPPIHPIGRTHRKGRNNSLDARPDDVGSPYAIGSADGGHDTVAPELGGLEQFLHFRKAVEARGMEVAMDLAIQASPDHPWVATHPEWFRHSPDGTHQVRREPAEEVPGHLPDRVRRRGRIGPRGAVARVEAGVRGLDRARGADLPGRQPAHQADPVLGVADPRDPARRTRT